MNYQTAFCWNMGSGKSLPESRNEDSLLLEQVHTGKGRVLLAAVSDGIGGLAEGETASGFLMEELKRLFFEELLEIISMKKSSRKKLALLEKSLRRRLYHSAERLSAYGIRRKLRLGATLSAVLMMGRRYLICSVGDSRVILISGRDRRCNLRDKMGTPEMQNLTKDDVDDRGRLLRCIGTEGWYPLQFRTGKLRRGEMLLVCTDGFWRRLQAEDLQERMQQNQWNSWLHETERRLRSRGERDDITAVCVSCM